MEVILKRTNELNSLEIQGLCDLFQRVFHKEKHNDFFKNQFTQNELGYSYHSMILSNDKIVGSWSYIPIKYNYFGTVMQFALAVDVMVDKEFSGDLKAIAKMMNLAYTAIKEDGIPAIYGFSNDNSYNLVKVLFRWQWIGRLNFYILPLNFLPVSKKLNLLNPLLKPVIKLLNLFSGNLANISADPRPAQIDKVSDTLFNRYRYYGDYKTVHIDATYSFTYSIGAFEGVRTCYLIDVIPTGKKVIENAVKYIYTQHKNEIDIIIFIGNLDFVPRNLFKVPRKFEPKKVDMFVKVLLPEKIDKRLLELQNWNANLSVFDVV